MGVQSGRGTFWFRFLWLLLGREFFVLITYHSAKQSKIHIAIPTAWAVFKQSISEENPKYQRSVLVKVTYCRHF